LEGYNMIEAIDSSKFPNKGAEVWLL
jgi:hypothetical protein